VRCISGGSTQGSKIEGERKKERERERKREKREERIRERERERVRESVRDKQKAQMCVVKFSVHGAWYCAAVE